MHGALLVLIVSSLTSLAAATGPGASLEVRFHPQRALRTHEVDSRRGWSGALMQNAVVVNGSGSAVTIDRVEIDLMSGDAALQTQRVTGAELDAAAKKGGAMQKAGLLDLYAFQFRPDLLLGKGVTLSGSPRLEPGTALLVGHRFFSFAGRADRVRLRAAGRRDDGSAVEAEGSLPVSAGASQVPYHFPLAGHWFVAAGQALHHHHRWVVPEEFALDIVRLGEGMTTHKGEGARLADYHAYGQEVLAAADGTVVSVEGSIAEAEPMPRRPGEPGPEYEKRIMAMQDALLAKGFLHAAGNHVVIEHAGGDHSFYGHLMPGSLRVAKGEAVKRGQPIGRLGNSGNSTEPHLHFHVTDGADPLMSAGVPVSFGNITLPLADGERAIQSGDVVEAR